MTKEEEAALLAKVANLEADIAKYKQQPTPIAAPQSPKSIIDNFKDLDEDERKFLQKVDDAVTQRLQPLLSQQQETQIKKQFDAAIAKFKNLDPEVIQRSEVVFSHWQKLGGDAAKFKPEEAIKFTLGEIAMADKTTEEPTPNIRTQQVITNANKPAPPPAKTDFDKMTQAERYQYLRDRVKNSKL